MKSYYYKILTIALLLSFSALGQTIKFDNSFGKNGKVITQIGSKDDYAVFSVISKEGSIFSAGYYIQENNVSDGFLIKYQQNGDVDSTFGTNGIAKSNFNTQDNGIRVVAIQSDGKIVAASSISSDIMLLRYHSNGTLDNSFGTNGIVKTHLSASQYPTALEILPNDKLIVSASIYNGINTDFGLLRYNANGTLDKTFGNNGYIISNLTNTYELNSSMKVQADGKIVLVGRVYTTYAQSRCIVARYNENGTLDNSFGDNGKAITNVGIGDFGVFNAVNIQPDNKIIAVGYSIEDIGGGVYDNKSLIVRYNTDGTIDTDFGTNGIALTECSGGGDIAWSLAIQPDGKILVGGYSSLGFPSFQSYYSLIRYNNDGELDTNFDSDGIIITDFLGNETNAAYSVTLQPDGKILLTGMTSSGSVDAKNIALVRFENDIKSDINYIPYSPKMFVYPNPISNSINIKSAEKIESIEIYNLQGEKVYSEACLFNSFEAQINQFKLPKGIYILEIINAKNRYSEKIIIE